jgi:hypothetical protein
MQRAILHHFYGANTHKDCAHVLLVNTVERNDAKLTAVCMRYGKTSLEGFCLIFTPFPRLLIMPRRREQKVSDTTELRQLLVTA